MYLFSVLCFWAMFHTFGNDNDFTFFQNFNTISKMVGSQASLLRFSVNAISGGMDAQGEVTVRLKENGLVALGKGADPDIITASAKAYINGLNRLEYMKRNPSLLAEERTL